MSWCQVRNDNIILLIQRDLHHNLLPAWAQPPPPLVSPPPRSPPRKRHSFPCQLPPRHHRKGAAAKPCRANSSGFFCSAEQKFVEKQYKRIRFTRLKAWAMRGTGRCSTFSRKPLIVLMRILTDHLPPPHLLNKLAWLLTSLSTPYTAMICPSLPSNQRNALEYVVKPLVNRGKYLEFTLVWALILLH